MDNGANLSPSEIFTIGPLSKQKYTDFFWICKQKFTLPLLCLDVKAQHGSALGAVRPNISEIWQIPPQTRGQTMQRRNEMQIQTKENSANLAS